MLIPFTIKQRIALENLLAVQQGKVMGDIRVYYNIMEKVQLAPVVRDRYIRQVPGGTVWDEDALSLCEPNEIELETEEINKLNDLLNTWERFITADLKWVMPLRKILTEALEPSFTKKQQPKPTSVAKIAGN